MFIKLQSIRKRKKNKPCKLRYAKLKLLQHMNLNTGEETCSYFDLEIQHSVMSDNWIPNSQDFAPSEADAAFHAHGSKESCFSEKFCLNHVSSYCKSSRVKQAESPSQSRPGSPHCCCADSLMEDAVVVPSTEAASRLKQTQKHIIQSVYKRKWNYIWFIFSIKVTSPLQHSRVGCHFQWQHIHFFQVYNITLL